MKKAVIAILFYTMISGIALAAPSDHGAKKQIYNQISNRLYTIINRLKAHTISHEQAAGEACAIYDDIEKQIDIVSKGYFTKWVLRWQALHRSAQLSFDQRNQQLISDNFNL